MKYLSNNIEKADFRRNSSPAIVTQPSDLLTGAYPTSLMLCPNLLRKLHIPPEL